MKTLEYKSIRLLGETGCLAENIVNHWLLGLRRSNPAILDIFRDRDCRPYRDLLPWSGEFAGKYLTGAYYIYRLTGRKDLYDEVLEFIDELLSLQDQDGYLGCFSKACRLTGARSQDPDKRGETWDSWAHYHIMIGLMLWYDLTGRPAYFEAVERIAQLFIQTFYGDGNLCLIDIGWPEMNLSVYHAFVLLYLRTRKPQYLTFTYKIEEDLSKPGAGEYIRYSGDGYEFYQCPKPRWESLHAIMGIAQMYHATGDVRYRDTACQIFNSILKTDVHNTGAFSTDEKAIGHPFRNGSIETCCVVAYNALAIEIYALTGESRIIDFLERSHYNAVLGSYSPTGRWSTYNTPMEGTRRANYHSISFQCRPGSPELNCCSVNAPRGVASVSEWMLTGDEDTVYINFYEAMNAVTSDGLTIEIEGNYPAEGVVRIRIDSAGRERRIALRIPAWSKHTLIESGNETWQAEPGYFYLQKVRNAEITVTFDFMPYTEQGDRDFAGKSSIFVGPVLYGFDVSENHDFYVEDLPAVRADELSLLRPQQRKDGSIQMVCSNGMILTDFYHLGISGCEYRTWLNVGNDLNH